MSKTIELGPKDAAFVFREKTGPEAYFRIEDDEKMAKGAPLTVAKLMFAVSDQEIMELIDKKFYKLVNKWEKEERNED